MVQKELMKWSDDQLRDELKRRGNDHKGGKPTDQGWPAVCSKCGVKTHVPFKPRTDWPVYCPFCYTKKMEAKNGR